MAINTLSLATKMTESLDKAIVQGSVTGFLADNVMKAKFVGAKTVLIPDVAFTGMGDYNRDDGFVQGSITVDRKSYAMAMDRGRTLQLDAQDEDETGVANLAGQVMGEYIRTEVVPELDAYNLSKLATFAIGAGQTGTGTLASEPYKIFTAAANAIYDVFGYEQPLIAFVDHAFMQAIQNSPEMARRIIVSDFKQGGVTTQVKTIDGIALRPVTSARMKSAYTFNDGKTAGQTQGGFAPATGAKNVRLLMIVKDAAMFVKKAEKTRVFSPDVNQKADAWKFDIRLYYDMFIKNSRKKGIRVFSEA